MQSFSSFQLLHPDLNLQKHPNTGTLLMTLKVDRNAPRLISGAAVTETAFRDMHAKIDRIILTLILANSVCMAAYDNRNPCTPVNRVNNFGFYWIYSRLISVWFENCWSMYKGDVRQSLNQFWVNSYIRSVVDYSICLVMWIWNNSLNSKHRWSIY